MEEVETKTRKDKRHKQGETEMDGRPTPGAGAKMDQIKVRERGGHARR